jgi:serine/threonine protein kinase
MASDKRPVIKARSDLKVTMTESPSGDFKSLGWVHFTADDEAYMGMSHKHPNDMTLDEFAAGLVPLDDKDIYPEVSAAAGLTVASEGLDEGAAFFKHSGFRLYQPPKELLERGFSLDDVDGEEGDAKGQMLEEALIMEKLSKTPHPYIVRYLGCRVRRGRITAIVLERLDWSLFTYAIKWPAEFAKLDKEAFLAGVESAVKFLHSLGLAHNDINPRNIMVREDDDGHAWPVLIDFNSCAPLGGLRRHGRSGTTRLAQETRRLRARPPA